MICLHLVWLACGAVSRGLRVCRIIESQRFDALHTQQLPSLPEIHFLGCKCGHSFTSILYKVGAAYSLHNKMVYFQYNLVIVVVEECLAAAALTRAVPFVLNEGLVALGAIHGGYCFDVDDVA